jgi:hypothetical protein
MMTRDYQANRLETNKQIGEIVDTEETLYNEWQAMKKRHNETLTQLQIDGNKALIKLIAEQFAERDELKKRLKGIR